VARLKDHPKTAAGLLIKLKDDTMAPILRVSNIATIPCVDGLKHFSNYYDFYQGGSGASKVEVISATADLHVFDCVPPNKPS
jgi:hypothetical protein